MADGDAVRRQLASGRRRRLQPGARAAGAADRIATYGAFYRSWGDSSRPSPRPCRDGQEPRFKARVRGYGNTLEAALADSEVDPAVYELLVREVNASLPTLHRYLELRARMLGLEDLAYYDLYPSLVPEVDDHYPWAGATEQVLAALAPMGSEYTDYLATRSTTGGSTSTRARASGRALTWPAAPTTFTRTCCSTTTDDYDSTSTLAHEAGHMMHSALTNRAQPYPTADYDDLRRRGGLGDQRVGALRLHPEARGKRRGAARHSRPVPGVGADHGLPPDHVRRVRAHHPPHGRAGQAAHARSS